MIRLSKNAFIRILTGGKIGYITNQLTKQDCTYDETGADFLSQLSRQPQKIENIVERLCQLYDDADKDKIQKDFVKFAENLSANHFVVMGNNAAELDAGDLDFSYDIDNFKTLAFTPTSENVECTDGPAQKLLMEQDRRAPRLTSLEFELTSRCNERCIHCYIPNSKKNAGFDMPFDKFKSIIDQFAAMGGLHVTLSGGEALMNGNILSMLRYCREKDLMISLLTNLTALKDEMIPVLKEVNLSLIQVSLYSMEPDLHDAVTTIKGSFAKSKAAIEKLHAAGVPLQISCPVMKANKDSYAAVMQYARSLNIKAMTDYIMMAESNGDTSNLANRISIEETEKVMRDIMEYDKDYKEETLKQQPLSSITPEEFAEMPVCGAGTNDLCVTVNGDIYPCAGWQDLVAGNVFKQPLKEIWEQSPVLAKVRSVRQKDFPKCLKCEARDYCNLCMVRNYNESGGDMFKLNEHFCKVAFLNKRLVEEWRKNQAK